MGYETLVFEEKSLFLVTGGAGFIGSNLCETILNMGYHVRCLDNLSTGKYENMSAFINHPNFTFIEGDICDVNTCLYACEDVDFVLHQAAWGSVPRSIENPLYYNKVNIEGTLNMMEAARTHHIKKFVYASSSSVYGDNQDMPKKEGQEGNVLCPYALTKRVDEEYGRLYKKLYDLDTYGMRYFNVFGKRQNPDGQYAAVIPKFVKLLLDNKQPVIYGDGKQSRDFTYIENVIEANLKACKASSKASGESFNIACGSCESLIDIYDKLASLLDKNISPQFGPRREGDIMHTTADIMKAKELLGYEAEWNFEKGILETIDWYKNNLN